MKKKYNKLYKFLNSWTGAVFFIIIGLLIAYFVYNTNYKIYILVLVGVPLFYYFKKQDYIPYIYGGALAAFVVYQIIGLVLSTNLPVVSVLSSSMQHDNLEITHYQWLERYMGYNRTYVDSWPISGGFRIGDMPIVTGPKDLNIGDVIVYRTEQELLPIIHRIIKINPDGTYQTKGDNNPGQLPYELSVKKEQIVGKVIFIIPKLGYFKVIMSRVFGVF